MTRALPVALAGATVAVIGWTLAVLAQAAVLKLKPPEGFGGLPSPPRPLDYSLLAELRMFAFLAFGPLPIALVLAALGEDAGFTEALTRWAKALTPLIVVHAGLSAVGANREARPMLTALLRHERYEPPVQRSSSIRMTGVAYFAAIFAGGVWVTGLPNAERPPQIIIQPAGTEGLP